MPVYRCPGCEAFIGVERGAVGPRCWTCLEKLDVTGAPQPVDAAQLQRAIARSPVPLIVDFWAPWCGPCLRAAPILRALGAQLAGELIVLAVDTQHAPQAAEDHEIYALPTVAFFHRGEEISRQLGALPPAHLEHWVQHSLDALQEGASA